MALNSHRVAVKIASLNGEVPVRHTTVVGKEKMND